MVRAGLLVAVSACSFQVPVEGPGIDASGSDVMLDAPVDMVDVPPGTFWQAVQGAEATGNSLVSIAPDGWGNSGAASLATLIGGNGYVEFSTSETTTGKAIGLSHGDDNQSFDDIDFDIVLGQNGRITIYEGSIMRGQFGPYQASDVFRVEVVGAVVLYRQNGTILYTSALSPTYPLLVDVALYTHGATLNNVVIVELP